MTFPVTSLPNSPAGTELGAAPLVPGIPERVHLVGIGGAGLSGVAQLLRARGHRISGTDRAVSPFVTRLREAGVRVLVEAEENGVPATTGTACGEAAENLLPPGVQAVARSAAVPESSAELIEARRRGIPIYKYSELLGRICPARHTLAVSGTHGKTTSGWMLYHALAGVAGLARTQTAGPRPGIHGVHGLPAAEPGALIGGAHLELGTNAIAPGAAAPVGSDALDPRGGWFVVEACEYDRTFLQLAPEGAIVTNIEADHLDYYGDLEAIEEAFARFLDRVHPDGLVVCGRDVPERVTHAAAPRVWRLGKELNVDLVSQNAGCFTFRLRGPGWATPPVALAVPGSFNVDNAALAIALAVGLAGHACDPSEAAAAAAKSLASFGGVERRFERWFKAGEVEVIHDYAHHPTEVRVNIEAARRTAPDRPVFVLFQPHQHSRTARFLPDFVEALRGADGVVVADVYGARVQIDPEVGGATGSKELVRRLGLARVPAWEGGEPLEAGERLVNELPQACTVLVLGAGDIDSIREHLEERLAVRRAGAGAPRG